MATVAKSDRSTTITLASASAGPFDLDFRLFDTDGLAVYVNDAPREDWTLSTSFNDGFDDNATLTFDAPLGEGSIIIIDGALTPWRQQNYLNSGQLVQKFNVELGRIWSVLAELFRNSRRSLRFFKAIDPVPLTAGKVLAINAEGTGIQLVEPRDAGVPDDELTMIKAFRTGQALLADPTESYTVGTILSPETENTRYIVAHPTETDPDIVTAGGVKAFEIGPEFSDIYKLRAAILRGDLRDGQWVSCYGQSYTIDATATGLESAFWRFGVDGLRLLGDFPDNLFVGTFFKNQTETEQQLFIGRDSSIMRRLNQFPIPRGAGGAKTGGRDAQPFWSRQEGQFMVPVTAGDGEPYDFSFYFMNGLGEPEIINCQITGSNQYGGVRGTTIPGAAQPVGVIWGPRFHNIGDAVWMTASLGTQLPDEPTNGTPVTMRPHICEVLSITSTPGAQAMVVGPPIAMNVGASTTPMLEPDLMQAQDGTWYMCIKNSRNRDIEIHSATDPINGAWTYVTTLDLDATSNSLEGPVWVESVYYDAATGQKELQIRVHAANNRNADDELRGVPVEFISTGGPEGPYGAAQDVNNSHQMRNGDLFSASLEPDPRAMASLLRAAASYSGEYPVGVDSTIRLPDEPHNFTPQQDCLYYVNTAGYACTLTVEKMEARRFWLACLSSDAGTKIDVVNSPLCVGPLTIGAGAFQITEFLWVDVLDKYVAVANYGGGGGGGSDGVADGLTFDAATNVLTVSRSVGDNLTVDLSDLDGGTNLGDWVVDGSGNLSPGKNNAADATVGTVADPVAGIVLRGRSPDGTNDGNNTPLLQASNGGGLLVDGADGHARSTIEDLSSFSGAHVWDRTNGISVKIVKTGDVSFNMSAINNGEVCRLLLVDGHLHNLTLTVRGTMYWSETDYGGAGATAIPAGTFWDRTELMFEYQDGITVITASKAVAAT
ncbi:hypothetical protein VWY34_14135 [Phaeobacter sp. JH20_02]|uniref:hypothetical protein n=1 Tax=unclassified Phaeobacter TaxID=2621772 RepID=UPI003A8A68DF